MFFIYLNWEFSIKLNSYLSVITNDIGIHLFNQLIMSLFMYLYV